MALGDEATSQSLDLPRLIAAVSTHKRWIIGPTLLAFVCAVGFVAVTKPRYTSTAKIMLANGDSYFTRPDKAAPDANAIIDDMTVASEAEAAKSPEVERKAMDKLTAEDLAEFSRSGGGLSALFGGGHGEQSAEDQRLDAFAKKFEVYPQAKTRVLLFEFTAHDRDVAARAANALAGAFLASQQDAKDAETRSASKWLSEQIDALRGKVAAAESRVEALRGKSGLLAGVNGLAVPSQQLSEIAAQIATARASEAGAAAKAASLRDLVRVGRLDDVASVANDESLRRYADSRVALKTQIAELGRTMLPGHPRMKELAGQLAGIEQEIRVAAMKRVRGFEEDARISANQVKSLEKAVVSQAQAVTSSDDDQVKLRELEIDAKTAREQLESYLTKYREALARNAVNASPANGRIIAFARPAAAPSFPKTGPTLLLASLAGLFVSLGLVIAKILLTDAPAAAAPAAARPAPFARPDRDPQMPFGIDPLPAEAEPEAEAEAELAQESGRDRQIWTQAVESFVHRLADTAEGDGLPLMVASEGGALPAALVAARRLSRRGSAVLVDLGPSPAWLSDLFDAEVGGGGSNLGLSDLARDPAARATHRDLSTSLDIVPSGVGATAPEDAGAVLATLAQAYDFVVVHAPDWREPVAARAVEDMAALLLAAPASEIGWVEPRVRAAYRDAGLAIKAIGVGPRPPVVEQAA